MQPEPAVLKKRRASTTLKWIFIFKTMLLNE
uniref:Uncharacterized protein n=1 Tax=Anguilla anguilla TaxID=7936 RepID=A0A0E9R5S5_ANGAN